MDSKPRIRVDRVFRFRLVLDLSFALSLSKGRPFMVRPEHVEGSLSKGHHERTTLGTLNNNEKTLGVFYDYRMARYQSGRLSSFVAQVC